MDAYPSLRAADPADPFYYLQNMETVAGWILAHHCDLLYPEEQQRLQDFLALPQAARALLTRLLMRSGELFRADRLDYPELPLAQALARLTGEGWLHPEPSLTPADLFRLYTLAELRRVADDLPRVPDLPRHGSKREWLARVCALGVGAMPLAQWSPALPGPVLQLRDRPLFERLRLMFFGNLRQSWTDFVLVKLGHQRFEPVSFTPESRAFHSRTEVDLYLVLHSCREQLEAGMAPEAVWEQLPDATGNAWLDRRRDRLLLELGRRPTVPVTGPWPCTPMPPHSIRWRV